MKQIFLVLVGVVWASFASAQTSTWTSLTTDRTVNAGQTITITNHAKARTVTVNGTLKASRTAITSLTLTKQLIVNPGGKVDLGTEADPIPCSLSHKLIFQLSQGQAFVGGADYSADPGVWVRGQWFAYGCATTRSWGRLVGDVAAGATQIVIDGDVADWPIGGQIVLTQTRSTTPWAGWPGGVGSESETELRTITAASGSTLTLNAPLTYAHLGSGEERGAVGLLSHNVSIETSLTGVTNVRNDVRVRKFACARIYEGGKAFLGYTQFYRMGSYGVNGCFALHWHRLGEAGRGQWARGLSFLETGFRATNIHESFGVRVEDTVAAYTGGGIVHWVQTDPESHQQDHELVHNMVAAHQPRDWDDTSLAGEISERASAFWPGVSDHELYAGNVSAGPPPDGAVTSGYSFFAGTAATFSTDGTIPRTFVKNEGHALTGWGLFVHGQRAAMPHTDLVGTHAWANSVIGIRMGAYEYRFAFHKTRIVGSPIGLESRVFEVLFQDGVIRGRGAAASTPDIGIKVDHNFFLPFAGGTYQRTSISDLAAAGAQQGTGIQWLQSAEPFCVPAPPDFEVSECATPWIRLGQMTFGPNLRPRVMGDAISLNDVLIDYDLGAVFTHKQQTTPTHEGPIAFSNSSTTYDANVDARKTPLSSLPSSVTWTNLVTQPSRPYGPFTIPLTYDAPPTVDLTVSVFGSQLTLTATPSADTTLVQYLVDGVVVGQTTTAPHTVVYTVPAGKRFVYAYARAFDGVVINGGCGDPSDCPAGYAQRAYSDVIEVGPELLGY